MKREDVSDALGLLDDGMIDHALMVRRKKRSNIDKSNRNISNTNKLNRKRLNRNKSNRSKIWKVPYIAAAVFCLFCISTAAVWFVFQHESGDATGQEDFPLNGQIVQADPELEMPERFVEVSSLLVSDAGNFVVEQAEKYTTVPIEEYRGIYTEVRSADGSVLAESTGKSIDGVGEWYYISGHSDLQYLIRSDEEGFSLWKFQCFDNGEYPYNDVLKLVYQIDSADAIAEIEVMPARMDNTDEGKKIQEEIGMHLITDRSAIETMYEVLSGMTCYGNGRWDMIDYGDVEMASDAKVQSHEAVRLGRYLAITTDYGNTIDGLKYTAVSDMFYEFSGIAYNTLTEEQAASVCEIIGIMESEGEVRQSNDGETDNVHLGNEKSDDGAKTILSENTNTNASLEYVTELQNRVSSAMMNHELPFVIKSSVYENPYRLHVVVTTDADEDLQKLWEMDTAGGVLEIEYSDANINVLQFK